MIKTAMSFALGCALFLQLPNLPSLACLWALPFCLLLLYFRVSRWLAIAFLASLWTLFYSHLILNNIISSDLIGKDIEVTGFISSIPEKRHKRIKFIFTPNQTTKVKLPSKIKLSWYKPLPETLSANQQWQLTIRLKSPHGTSNPGTFDYERWLFQNKIGATGYVRSTGINKQLSDAPPYAINSLRESLTNTIRLALPESDYFGLIQGLTTGIKSAISASQWENLRHSGTSHLLAISGLHIGLAAALGFYICRWLWSVRAKNLLLLPANNAGALGGFFIALFYAAMAGFALPTQRALIMLSIVMIALLSRRPVLPQTILAFSAIVILVHNPLSVLSAGFWLSFGAVAIILFISQNHYPKSRLQWIKIHVLLAVGLSPLLLLFFRDTSLIAPIANIIAVPFISLIIVPLVLLASATIWLIEPIGVALFQLADILLSYFWPILEYLAALPLAHWTSPEFPLWIWLLVTMSLVLLLSPRGFPNKWLGLIGLLPLLFYKPATPKTGEVWFTLLDVGQGLSAVIQTQKHTLIYDTGPKFSESFDSGKSIILPYLASRNIKNIDMLIITHGDNDHIGGAQSIINALSVNKIMTSDINLLDNAKPCLAGIRWQWDQVNFKFFHPKQSDVMSENNLSCVLQISSYGKQILLTGDIEKMAEQQLVTRYGNELKSTVLIAPHHGSKTSSTPLFLDTVNPEIALFPVGFANRFNLPASSTLKHYKQRNILTFLTSDLGAISLKITQNGLTVPSSWRKQQQKIGHYAPDSTE